jgi:hypothetical protein
MVYSDHKITRCVFVTDICAEEMAGLIDGVLFSALFCCEVWAIIK